MHLKVEMGSSIHPACSWVLTTLFLLDEKGSAKSIQVTPHGLHCMACHCSTGRSLFTHCRPPIHSCVSVDPKPPTEWWWQGLNQSQDSSACTPTLCTAWIPMNPSSTDHIPNSLVKQFNELCETEAPKLNPSPEPALPPEASSSDLELPVGIGNPLRTRHHLEVRLGFLLDRKKQDNSPKPL